MGKQGAVELNYSWDIDVWVFTSPRHAGRGRAVEPEGLAMRMTQGMAGLLPCGPGTGVFRMDLRLLPHPSSTPAAVPVETALEYYKASARTGSGRPS